MRPRTKILRWMLPLTGLIMMGLMMWLQVGCDSQFEEFAALGEGEIEVGDPMTPLHIEQMEKTKHRAIRQCRQCHASGASYKSRSFTKPIPELCYGCHENRRPSQSYVHGPVAVGECLFCHRPHVSTYQHLLKVSQPRLCIRCHDKENSPLSALHQEVTDQRCTNCHDPHGSEDPMFLKKL